MTTILGTYGVHAQLQHELAGLSGSASFCHSSHLRSPQL
jgi:hypothetical protein